ncbi:MAG: archease [Chloroflexota bacterium]
MFSRAHAIIQATNCSRKPLTMVKDFEILEHTADVGIVAHGDGIRQAFANAARGLSSIITNLDDIDEGLHWDITVEADEREDLLVAWLNELIYLFDVEAIIFKRFDITQMSNTRLKARAYGEKIDSRKHIINTGVKAATYHLLKVEADDGCRVQVLFDI